MCIMKTKCIKANEGKGIKMNSKKKNIIGIVVGTVWYLTVLSCLTGVFQEYYDENTTFLLVALVNIIGIIAMIIFTGHRKALGFTFKSFRHGLIISAPLTLFVIYSLVSGLVEGFNECGSMTLNKQQFLIWILGYFVSAGICEEFLCRGLFLNSFISLWGKSKKGILLSMISSSILFGLFHLVNLLDPEVYGLAVIGQIIYSLGFGILFAAIYIRSNNIWVPVVIHFLYDAGQTIYSECFYCYEEGNSEGMSILSYFILCVTIFLACTLWGLFLVRNKKIKDVIE